MLMIDRGHRFRAPFFARNDADELCWSGKYYDLLTSFELTSLSSFVKEESYRSGYNDRLRSHSCANSYRCVFHSLALGGILYDMWIRGYQRGVLEAAAESELAGEIGLDISGVSFS